MLACGKPAHLQHMSPASCTTSEDALNLDAASVLRIPPSQDTRFVPADSGCLTRQQQGAMAHSPSRQLLVATVRREALPSRARCAGQRLQGGRAAVGTGCIFRRRCVGTHRLFPVLRLQIAAVHVPAPKCSGSERESSLAARCPSCSAVYVRFRLLRLQDGALAALYRVRIQLQSPSLPFRES